MKPLHYREVMHLAWPSAIAMLGETAMGLVDTKLVSSLGASALAGVGIGVSLFWLGFITLLGFIRGIKVCTAYAVGQGEPHKGIAYATLGTGLVGLIGLLGAWALQHSAGFLQQLGINPEIAYQAEQFLSARAWGLPAACAATALMEHRQGLGEVRKPAMISIAGNVLNAILAYGLIHGRWGLPAWGIRGAGFGTAISEMCQCIIGLLWLLHTAYKIRGKNVQWPSWSSSLAELVALGLPTALHFGCEYLAFMSFTFILGGLTQNDVAANQIAISISRTAFLPGIAIGEAVCILVGQALGGGDLAKAERTVEAGMRLAMGFMVTCGLVFVLFGKSIASFFTEDPAILLLVVQLLLIAGAFQIFDSVNITMRSALRGAKDVRMVAIIGISILWTCIPTAAYFLGKRAHLGVIGGWYGFIAESILSACFFSWRWYRGPWRQRYMATKSP